MKKLPFLLLTALLLNCRTAPENATRISGLTDSVEIFRDAYGINHIYAQNEHDLFFAQGYAAAKDRLFQFEVWRRQATGTTAEILGPRQLKRDIGTRLFKYRGDLETEFNYYHDNGSEIIRAYTDGVNAYIREILKTPEKLPMEFKALGIQPELWTPEVVISRHQGLLGNIDEELDIGRAVALIGAEAVRELCWFHPKDPILDLHPSISSEMLQEDILELYLAYRRPLDFKPEDVQPGYRSAELSFFEQPEPVEDKRSIGSNNWVVQGEKMTDKTPVMANDPHRTIAVPSLRYMAHLVAPGWDVIGGGEPEIPGISIGHNQYGAWGLTVFATDGEDLMVYDTHPENPDQYRYKDQWVTLETIEETIAVKGQEDVTVQLQYSIHGPVVFKDSLRNKAYAVQAAWLEAGGSPYLASLRMDQAKNWEEFRMACEASHIPGENMIWADIHGDIGWQAVGIAPIRRNFSGWVPVPGDGSYEWDGYLPIREKPHLFNPEKGYIATANQNVTPEDYEHWDAIGYSWSDPFRGDRIDEVLDVDTPLSFAEMVALQVDEVSLPARHLVALLSEVPLGDLEADKARLLNWDFRLNRESVPAAIYVLWEEELTTQAAERFIPAKVLPYLYGIQLHQLIGWLETAAPFENTAARDEFLAQTFRGAIAKLEADLGPDRSGWVYGQEALKHSQMNHGLSAALAPHFRDSLDVGPLPRGGNGYTVGSTGNNLKQRSGASFKVVIPVGEWDNALGMNAPGQSGNPASPYYQNLFERWANNEYFPLLYSRDSIEAKADAKILLMPE